MLNKLSLLDMLRKKNITFELYSSFKFIKKAVVKRILNVLKQINKIKSWNKKFNLKNIKYLLKDIILFINLNLRIERDIQH